MGWWRAPVPRPLAQHELDVALEVLLDRCPAMELDAEPGFRPTPLMRGLEAVAARRHLHDPDDDVAYWLSRPVEERIAALTEIRRALFELGDDDHEARNRLPRVHRVLERP